MNPIISLNCRAKRETLKLFSRTFHVSQKGLQYCPQGLYGFGAEPQRESGGGAPSYILGVWGWSPQIHSCDEATQGLGAEPLATVSYVVLALEGSVLAPPPQMGSSAL